MIEHWLEWMSRTAHAAQDDVVKAGIGAIDWITWLWVLGLSTLGGSVNFYRKLKQGHVRPFNVAELLGELMISAFVGVVTFLLCKGAGLNEFLTAGLVGLTGHMGTRAIMRMEKYLENRLGKG